MSGMCWDPYLTLRTNLNFSEPSWAGPSICLALAPLAALCCPQAEEVGGGRGGRGGDAQVLLLVRCGL